MVVRIKLTLEQTEFSALNRLADVELRSLADEARFIIRRELARMGFLEEPEVNFFENPTTQRENEND